MILSYCTRPAIPKYYKLGGLNNKHLNCISHSSGGWKSDLGASRLGFLMRVLLLVYKKPSCCVVMWWKENLLAFWPPIIKASSHPVNDISILTT